MAVMLARMARIKDMLIRAERCEEMADKVKERDTAYALRDAAQHWRSMAVQMDLLEREPSYRMLRDRTD